jgi:large subunit ribosomal protein L18
MNEKVRLRLKRHRRVRGKVHGTPERPRLAVFRSLKHIYAQIIDDERGATLAAASSVEPSQRQSGPSGGNIEGAKAVGQRIAERAKAKGITQVVFDRGGFMYHGRVKELADAARAGGLDF